MIHDFWHTFATLSRERQTEFWRVWLAGQRKSRGGDWTDKPFTSFLELVLYPGLADRLGLVLRSKGNGGEVARFDAAFFRPGMVAGQCADNATIVLEHENKRNDQSREVEKLAQASAPFRVLIFYTKPGCRTAALESVSRQFDTSRSRPIELLAIWGEAEAQVGPTYCGFRMDGQGDWDELGAFVLQPPAAIQVNRFREKRS